MNRTQIIVLLNFGIFVFQFFLKELGLIIFALLLVVNIVGGIIGLLLKDKEIARTFFLSATVIGLIGPVMAAIYLWALCSGAPIFGHVQRY